MYSDLLSIAREVATTAAELVARRRSEGVAVADRKSSSVDIVTHADRESEALIREMLAKLRPGDGFYGEEGSADAAGTDTGTSGLTWVVDPIDGTVNYLYGIPQYGVSIAVVEGDPDPLTWTALAGVVASPATGEVFSAATGSGAWLESAFLGSSEIHVAAATPLAEALIGTGFSYSSESRGVQGAVVARLLTEVRDIRRIGAASLDLCYVANGRLNAYYERGLKPWDHAAGALIAREAGARVAGLDGAPADASFLLAAESSVAAALEARLLDLGI